MIELGSNVQFNGSVSSLGTAAFGVAINEFLIDEQWKRFITPKVVEIATADYDDHLTSTELTFISTTLERMQSSTNFNNFDHQETQQLNTFNGSLGA